MNARAGKRVILVTGASRGLGRAIALRFGKSRDRVVINYREQHADAESVAREIESAGGEPFLQQADVRNADAVEIMMRAVMEKWGAIDVLVNNAGMTRDNVVLSMSEDSWDEVIAVNLTGAFHCIRSCASIMAEQGQGHIISIASLVGMQGRAGQANYAASKAGLIGLTRSAAKELGASNIRINAILPGFIRTDMSAAASEQVLERAVRENALNRISDAGEISDFVHYLSVMQHVSGQVFNLDSRIV